MEGGGEHQWTARDRMVVARMKQYLNESDTMKKVESEEWEQCLCGQWESEVDIRHIVMNAKGEKHRRLFQMINAQGQSEFLVVSAA